MLSILEPQAVAQCCGVVGADGKMFLSLDVPWVGISFEGLLSTWEPATGAEAMHFNLIAF